MSRLSKVRNEIIKDPPRFVIYGKPKVGKNTFVAQCPNPLTVCFEDGSKGIKTPSYMIEDYEDFIMLVDELINEQHDYKTLNIDNITFMEKSIHQHLCKKYNAKSIELVEGGYGKGFIMASEILYELLLKLDILCSKRRMIINFLGHQVVAEDVNADGDDYKISRFDANRHIVGLLERWADGILCMSQKVYTKKEDKGFGNKVTKVNSTSGVVLICGGSAGILAKTRYSQLPNEIPISEENGWDEFLTELKKGNK